MSNLEPQGTPAGGSSLSGDDDPTGNDGTAGSATPSGIAGTANDLVDSARDEDTPPADNAEGTAGKSDDQTEYQEEMDK